jgi:hypothetical protein
MPFCTTEDCFDIVQLVYQVDFLHNLVFLSFEDLSERYYSVHFGIPIYKGIPNRTI